MEDLDFDYQVPEKMGVCSECKQEASIVETWIDSVKQEEILCYDCAEKLGFCFGCGCFSAGTEAYDFSKIGAYCEHCQDEIKADELEDDEYENDEEDDQWDDDDERENGSNFY